MALQGTFQDFGLPDIFQLISLQRKSGVLTVRSDQETIRIVFYQGHIIEADSEPHRFEDRLGQVLVRTGRLTQEQLEKALEHQRKTLKRLGLVLLELGFIDEQTLRQALEMQITQTVYRTFRWKSGEYSFEIRDDIAYDPRIDLMLPTDNVLMEGIQIVDEWPVIQRRIPDFNLVFRQNVSEEAITVIESTDELDLSFGLIEKEQKPASDATDAITMTKEEFQIFQAIDGKKSINDIIQSLPIPEFTVLKTLYDFINRGLIEAVQTTHRITEVIETIDTDKRERPKARSIPGIFTGGVILFCILIVKSFFSPLSPYSPPDQSPFYSYYVYSCQPLVKDLLIGHYLQMRTWPKSTDAIAHDAILAQCVEDPLGRPITIYQNDSKLEYAYLNKDGNVMVNQFVPRPFLNELVVLDPLQRITIRSSETETPTQ